MDFSVVARMGEVLASEEAGGEISPLYYWWVWFASASHSAHRHRHA